MVQSRGASRASSYLTPETEKEENPDYYCVFTGFPAAGQQEIGILLFWG